MFDDDDGRLKEEDFLYVPEFRKYLENAKKGTGTGFAPKTIRRHVVNVIDFLYYCSTHNYEVEINGPDEVPVNDALIRRGKEFISAYFTGWLSFHNGESEDSVRQSGASVKKFYRFLKETKRIDAAVADEILEDLKYEFY